MQLGKPVICLDRSGLADIVTDRCGIRIDASDEEAVVQGLADALLHLSEGRDVLRRLGIGAAERIRDAYTWETRKNYLSKIYEQVLEEA
jgi:glycosyltransferase involved in cell wall biosynthesis